MLYSARHDNLSGATQVTDTTAVSAHGDGLFWLLRSAEACNVGRAGGSYGGVGEFIARDSAVDACPD